MNDLDKRADLLPGKIVDEGIEYWLSIEKSNYWVCMYDTSRFDDMGDSKCLYLTEDIKLSGVIEKMIKELGIGGA